MHTQHLIPAITDTNTVTVSAIATPSNVHPTLTITPSDLIIPVDSCDPHPIYHGPPFDPEICKDPSHLILSQKCAHQSETINQMGSTIAHLSVLLKKKNMAFQTLLDPIRP